MGSWMLGRGGREREREGGGRGRKEGEGEDKGWVIVVSCCTVKEVEPNISISSLLHLNISDLLIHFMFSFFVN